MHFSKALKIFLQVSLLITLALLVACKKQNTNSALPKTSTAQANTAAPNVASGQSVMQKLNVKETLAKDFNIESIFLDSISGGWGYSAADAVKILNPLTAKDIKDKRFFNFVPLEYNFARIRNIEEFGISPEVKFIILSEEGTEQTLLDKEAKKYDKITFKVGLVPFDVGNAAYEQIKQNPEKEKEILDLLFTKRLFTDREYWFDITDVYEQYMLGMKEAEAQKGMEAQPTNKKPTKTVAKTTPKTKAKAKKTTKKTKQ